MTSELELDQIYSFFKGSNATLTAEGLFNALSSVGIILSMKEQREKEAQNSFTIDEFKALVKSHTFSSPEETMLEAFKIFDKENTGKISSKEFKHVMTTLGEKMNDEEYTKMLAEMKINPNDEEINYNEMVKFLAAD